MAKQLVRETELLSSGGRVLFVTLPAVKTVPVVAPLAREGTGEN